MNKIIGVLLVVLCTVPAIAQDESGMTRIVADSTQTAYVPVLSDADSAYIQGDYLKAISIYESVIGNQGVNATLYMNLGNCWLKRDEIAKAILCYERAYLIDPSDPDIRFNLELARTKTVDKVSPVNQLFIVVWFKKLLAVLDINGWDLKKALKQFAKGNYITSEELFSELDKEFHFLEK